MGKFEQLCRHTAKEALHSEYGFGPKVTDITLLETREDRTFLFFRVRDSYYKFSSYAYEIGDSKPVWVGRGTITRTDERGVAHKT